MICKHCGAEIKPGELICSYCDCKVEPEVQEVEQPKKIDGTLSILPVIVVYLVLSKFIVKGVALGAVKG